MAKEKNAFAKILGNIRTALSLESKKDMLKSDIQEFNDQNVQKQNYIDVINKLNADNAIAAGKDKKDVKSFTDEMDAQLKNMQANPDLPRLTRYQELEFMTVNLPQVSRALQIYTDNIVSPNDITKQSLTTKISETLDKTATEVLKNSIDKIKLATKIEDKIDTIVYQTLNKGDYFVEIVNMNDIKIDKLSESKIVEESISVDKDNKQPDIKVKCIFNKMTDSEVDDVLLTESKKDDELESLLESDTKNEENDTNKKVSKNKEKPLTNLANLTYKYHKPENVIKISKDSLLFGYIIFSPRDDRLINTGETKIGVTNSYMNTENSNKSLSYGSEIINKVVDTIKKAIKNKNKELTSDTSEMYDIVKKMLIDSNTGVNARFVKPDHIVHFKLPGKFDDYGEGLFYNIRSTARMYMITLHAVTIARLTRSMEKRVFEVEIGDSIDSAGLIQTFKKSIKQKSVIFSDNVTMDNIPDMVSMFEDYYIPARDGTPFVKIDTIAGQNLNDRLEELEFLRKQMLVGVGVPPTILGYEQDASYTTTLSQENSMFAQTIIRLQKNFNSGFTELFEKIYNIINTSNIEFEGNVIITLQPPKILQIQRDSEIISNLQTIKDVLESFDVPKEYIMKKYFSGYIDDAEVKRLSQQDTIKTSLTPESPDSSTNQPF